MEPQDDKLFDKRKIHSRTTRREKLPWPKDRTYKILSLDGGGIKGVFTACLIKHIERCFANGKPLACYFDHIAGTSTGGIIALGLGLHISTQRIADLYLERGSKIFPPWRFRLRKRFGKIGQILWPKSVFDREILDGLLRAEFGEKLYRDCGPRMTIPSFKLPEAELAVLKTDHHPDYKRDPLNTCAKIAAATSAAPTFLKGVENGSTVFFDGGIWANNPIMLAVIEAKSVLDVSCDMIEILSIGTGSPSWSSNDNRLDKGALGWSDMFEGMMYLNGEASLSEARLLIGPENVLRVDPEGEAAKVDMADWTTAKRDLPTEAERLFRENEARFKRFFLGEALPRERFLPIHVKKDTITARPNF